MEASDLKALAETMKGALPLEYSPGECDAFVTYSTGEDAAVIFGPGTVNEDIGARDMAIYLCVAANALPGLLERVAELEAGREKLAAVAAAAQELLTARERSKDACRRWLRDGQHDPTEMDVASEQLRAAEAALAAALAAQEAKP